MSYSNHIKSLVQEFEQDKDITIEDIVKKAKGIEMGNRFYTAKQAARTQEKIYHFNNKL
jgi:hypothetical protein